MEAADQGDPTDDEAGDPGDTVIRTLDAFRVFDSIYILARGSNGTVSVSMLGYDNLFVGFNLDTGSAISVLIFIVVAVFALVFVKLFGVAAPCADTGGEALAMTTGWGRKSLSRHCSTSSARLACSTPGQG